MKKFFVVLIMAFTFLPAIGQDDNHQEIKTLFSNQKSIGFYGSLSLGYSQIHGKDALTSGVRAAMIFNHSTAIGLAGYGFANDMESYKWEDENALRYSLAGGYGGIFIEPIVGGMNPVHVSFPVLFGIGGVAQVSHYGTDYWEYPYNDTYENDMFFIVEPAIELEVNLARFFRTAATFSYRFTTDVELPDVAPNVLRGPQFGLTFKFGKF